MSTKKPAIRIVKRQDIPVETQETAASDLNQDTSTAGTATSVHDWVRSFKSERRIESRVTFGDLFRKSGDEDPQSLTIQPVPSINEALNED